MGRSSVEICLLFVSVQVTMFQDIVEVVQNPASRSMFQQLPFAAVMALLRSSQVQGCPHHTPCAVPDTCTRRRGACTACSPTTLTSAKTRVCVCVCVCVCVQLIVDSEDTVVVAANLWVTSGKGRNTTTEQRKILAGVINLAGLSPAYL